MQWFYTNDIRGELAFLGPEESRHCVQVLRRKPGDAITFVDGEGGYYEAILVEAHKKACVLRIQKHLEAYTPAQAHLHIAIAPTKNIGRMEWFLEKTTEIGIDEISPIYCQRSERRTLRSDRLNKILLSAMKQSLKARLPKLNEAQQFEQWIQQWTSEDSSQMRFIAHCAADQLPELYHTYRGGEDVVILIGPEGDFSTEEIDRAKKHGFVEIGLGKSRLRTETAGIVACHTVRLKALDATVSD